MAQSSFVSQIGEQWECNYISFPSLVVAYPQSPLLSHKYVKPRDDKSSLLKINGCAVSLLFSAPALHQY